MVGAGDHTENRNGPGISPGAVGPVPPKVGDSGRAMQHWPPPPCPLLAEEGRCQIAGKENQVPPPHTISLPFFLRGEYKRGL